LADKRTSFEQTFAVGLVLPLLTVEETTVLGVSKAFFVDPFLVAKDQIPEGQLRSSSGAPQLIQGMSS